MTLQELIAALTEHAKTDQGRTAVIDALHTGLQPVYQAVYTRGHEKAKEEAAAAATELQTKLTAAEQARTDLATKLAEAEKKGTPDVEAIRTQHKADLERVQAESKTREEGLTQRLAAERSARAKSDLKALLKGRVVDDLVEVAASRHEGRLRHRDDGSLSVLQAGSEVELQVPAGKSALELLAEEIYQATPATLRLSQADGGSGVQTGTAGGSAGGYDPVAAGKQMAEQQKAQATNVALALS